MEHFRALGIDAAEYAKVPVTDDIIRAQAGIIQQELDRVGVDEPYDGFEMSNEWLKRFKNRHNFGRFQTRGQSGDVNQAALLTQRRCYAHGLPVRIYRAQLPYLDAHELRKKKITPSSSPGVGTACHHWPPG